MSQEPVIRAEHYGNTDGLIRICKCAKGDYESGRCSKKSAREQVRIERKYYIMHLDNIIKEYEV